MAVSYGCSIFLWRGRMIFSRSMACVAWRGVMLQLCPGHAVGEQSMATGRHGRGAFEGQKCNLEQTWSVRVRERDEVRGSTSPVRADGGPSPSRWC